MSRGICFCAQGCDRNPFADPGVFPPCRCWCHDRATELTTRDGESTVTSITCPRCGMTSYNPNDVREGYCGNCHEFTSPPTLTIPQQE